MHTTKMAAFALASVVVGWLFVRDPVNIPTPPIVAAKPVESLLVPVKKEKSRGGVISFMRHMARIESNNRHDIVNRFGMMGKYQFHPRTVRELGFKVSRKEFLSNPVLQDSVMVAYMRSNRSDLRKLIRKYAGKRVNGVMVTESGILAGAHLGGTGGLLAFFYPERFNGKTVDANGTSIALYMKKFGGYNLSGL